MGLPDYKPVSVLRGLTIAKRQSFLLATDFSVAPATYPEVVTERAAPPPLFGLAPHGVCPASSHCCGRGALLPHLFTLTRQRLTPRTGGTFSVALSVKPALSEPPRPLAGMLPCGDRTFLPTSVYTETGRLPVRQARNHYQGRARDGQGLRSSLRDFLQTR
jgi:hypothetical protein